MLPMLYIAGAVVKKGHRALIMTADYGAESFKKKVEDIGAELLPLATGGLTEEEVEKSMQTKKANPFVVLQDAMAESSRQQIASLRPDA